MTLDDTLGRLQDAAWEHAASLPDEGGLTNEQLAGWAQVSRAAQPLLTALDRTDLIEPLRRSAAAIPARPAANATADPALAAMASNLRDLHDQLPQDEMSRQNVRDVVSLVIQSTARTASAAAQDTGNPQVRRMAPELDATAIEARASVQDPQARAVPTPESGSPQQRSQAAAPDAQQRAQERRDALHSTRKPPTQAPGRHI